MYLSPLIFLGGQHQSVPLPFSADGYKTSTCGRFCQVGGGVATILGSSVSKDSGITGVVGSVNGFPNTDAAHALN